MTRPVASSPSFQARLRSELLRQRDILDGEATVRFVATALGYLISALFLPVGIVVALAAINLLAEVGVYAFQRDVDRLMSRGWRYWGLLACVFLHEACFVVPPALMWHLEDPYTKAYAVGMTASTMMHVATVRAIHLPMGLAGAAAIWIIVLTSNTLYWAHSAAWLPLGLTTLCALVALSYFVSALVSNHRLHRETSAGWAEATEANAAKTRFLTQISHELRTPLNAILGMGHAELARQTDDEGRGRMHLLIESASALGVLLDDILDMSALQEGRLPIRPAPLDLPAAIAATVALFRPQAEAAGLTLDLVMDAKVPRAACLDGQRLRQCLSNILSNALKHTERGGVQVMVSHPAEAMLRIEVQDTGNGVPEALHAAIFEPFQRGPGVHGGTGLGLTISRTLAQRMGGDLVLLPSDRGARFGLTLALVPATLADIAPRPAEPPLNLAGRLVLVVDDIATNRLVAATYLRQLGATVSEADSGAAALDVVAAERPCAILLDMNMPGMDGIETLGRLRALPGPVARVPVIAMTADATETHRRLYLASGMDGYVSKPLTPDRLTEALRPHLADRTGA